MLSGCLKSTNLLCCCAPELLFFLKKQGLSRNWGRSKVWTYTTLTHRSWKYFFLMVTKGSAAAIQKETFNFNQVYLTGVIQFRSSWISREMWAQITEWAILWPKWGGRLGTNLPQKCKLCWFTHLDNYTLSISNIMLIVLKRHTL